MKFIFEVFEPNASLLESWNKHNYLNEIELRFQAESSLHFCHVVFSLLPNLKTVYLANYSFDEKVLIKEYPHLDIKKKW